MQIPILNGIYTDNNADFRTSYPVNMIPVPKMQGISNGYLRPSDGVETLNASTGGIDRGGFSWGGLHYRVIGNSFCRVSKSGDLTIIGAISGNDRVKFTYSFDRLAICANNDLFYYDGTTLEKVTDENLGNCLDVVWVDGYFLSTDGEFLIVSDLNNPFNFDALKFGSSEVDPDPIVALYKIRNEIYAVNRDTIEVFNNVGGTGFPFRRVPSAQITRGAVSRNCSAQFNDSVVFLGGRQNEALGVWIAANGNVQKISNREIDQIIKKNTEHEHATRSLIEVRFTDSHEFIYFHLPNETLVYDVQASKISQQQTWHKLRGGIDESRPYQARNFVYVYDDWYCGHRNQPKIGILSNAIQSQWGEVVSWEFSTQIIYNNGNGAIIHELELMPVTGNVALGENPSIYTQYSEDGRNYSMPKFAYVGKQGNREKRILWRTNGKIKRFRIQKFVGNSDAFVSIAALDLTAEPLTW